MAISKKIRFEVFKRDGFQCCYCGKTPPEVVLEVDHIEPKAKGGGDDINNLLTACFDCNRGKKDILLSKAPLKLSENLEILKQKEIQLKEYRKFVKKIEVRTLKDIATIDAIYQQAFPGRQLSDQFKNISLNQFLKLLPLHEIEEAMFIATSKIPQGEKAIKYFCGICWSKIRGNRNAV